QGWRDSHHGAVQSPSLPEARRRREDRETQERREAGAELTMDLKGLLAEALRAIRTHTLRSFLTLLGIIIGVATLVGVVSVISGLNGFVQNRVIQLSPEVYIVKKFGIIRSRDEFLD